MSNKSVSHMNRPIFTGRPILTGTLISHEPISELRKRDKSGRREKGRITQI
jgi:hypothetical protein